MGRYYGLLNSTKRHRVSCGNQIWKSNPPSIEELKDIAKTFNWDLEEDVIFSGSYRDIFVYKKDKWIQIFGIDTLKYECECESECNEDCKKEEEEFWNEKECEADGLCECCYDRKYILEWKNTDATGYDKFDPVYWFA